MDEFYTNLRTIYENGGGWSGYYYGIFSKVIRENNFKICAEVGIGYGFHAREILDNTSVERLYLVDPMRFYPNDIFVDDVMRYGGFEKLVHNIKMYLEEHEDRYTWFRCESTAVTHDQIPDGSLDAVFIDADHSYDAVRQDLAFWWKKLRIGGWLLGDDYDSCHPGTPRAVDEFCQIHTLPIEFLSKPNATKEGYPIYKLIKTRDI